MERRLRPAVSAFLLSAGLLLGLGERASADSHPGDDSDSITISIIPVIDIGVEMDTAAMTTDVALALGTTHIFDAPASLRIVGNFQPQELELSAQNIASGALWSLDEDETAQEDQIQIYGLFSDTAKATAPAELEFAGVKNLLTGAVKHVGMLGGNPVEDGNFENTSMTYGAQMDNILLVAPYRKLWLRADTPPASSTADTQKIQVTLTATTNR